MERSEPTLVPEWLKSSGSSSGGVTSNQHFVSSSHSDTPSTAFPSRTKSFKSINEFDTHHSNLLERSASSNSRKSCASNGSPKHPYSSFGRSHRAREKERSVIGDYWDADPLAKMATARDVNSTLWHSQLMVSQKMVDLFPGRAEIYSQNGSSKNYPSGNGVLSTGSISNNKKAAFETDFPSLGTEERQGSPDTGRVPSPGLNSVRQSLLMSNSALMSGEGWSALADVPVLVSSNTVATQPSHHSAVATPVSPVSAALGSAPGLNMAEALAQAPLRARTAPQVSIETQRLEELAIRKSRQLIPVTPSMPKASIISYSDKKAKIPMRNGEIIGPTKSTHQPPSLLPASQSLRYGQVRSEAPKIQQAGKFLVLKPLRENGVSHAPQDVTSPTSNVLTSNQLAVDSVTPASDRKIDTKVPNNRKVHAVEGKASSFSLKLVTAAEKRPLSQAKSRSDFFNLMRKKSSINASTVLSDPDSVSSSSTMEKSGELVDEVASDPASPAVTENGKMNSNGDASEEAKGFSDHGEENLFTDSVVDPDEEEAAFLRSLGWDENGGEGGLTEEEINAFYQECMKMKPALLMCRGIQPKLSALSEACPTTDVNPSGPKTEA